VITISVCTDEDRQAVAQAMENGSLAAALGVPFEVERVSTGPGGGAGTYRFAIGFGGIGATYGCGPGGGSGTLSHGGGTGSV
jgi:hypothetical protein